METTSNTSSIALTMINSGTGISKQASFYLTSGGNVAFQTNQTVGGEPTTGNTALTINPDSSVTINSSANATTAINNGAGNGIGNIGSSSNYFNTVYATATTALYADLAEMYVSDADYPPGTVVSFGGDQEITLCVNHNHQRVAGVISTKPSYLMNSGQQGQYVLPVALTGRVPCRVTGQVRKGDLMVSAGNGQATVNNTAMIGTVIGKALQDFDGESGMIEVVVGRV